MARTVGVETPIMTSIIKIVSVLLETDFRHNALRTLEQFGLGGLSKEEILKAVS